MFELFWTFLKIGLFTIGGGYAMIPLIQQKVVEEKKWVSQDELLDLIAVAQSCPGIFAVNISIFIGYKKKGTAGAFFCTLGTCLPSFLIILALALFFQHFRENIWIDRFFKGIRPAVVALIAVPVVRMAKMGKISWHSAWIPIAAVGAICLLGVSPIYVILAAGLGGYAYGQYLKE